MSSSRTNNTSSGMFSPKPMSWSRPRESLRPQFLSRSSDGSVRRPDFCMASLMRSLSMGFMGFSGVTLQAIDGERITAIAVGEATRHASDGGDADAGQAVDLAIGDAFLQPVHDRPAVRYGLEFRGRAEVAEECAALVHGLEGQHSGKQ